MAEEIIFGFCGLFIQMLSCYNSMFVQTEMALLMVEWLQKMLEERQDQGLIKELRRFVSDGRRKYKEVPLDHLMSSSDFVPEQWKYNLSLDFRFELAWNLLPCFL